MFKSETQRLQVMAWGVMLFLLIITAFSYTGNGDDAYWHIKVGEWILTHHQIPTTGIFSYTNPDKQWTAHEWLSQVLTYKLFQQGGWAGLFFFTLLCLFATVQLLLWFLLKRLSTVQSLIFVLFAYLLLIPHILPRPHIFAIPLMTYWTICLIEASEKQTKPPFYIVPLMVLWVNMHGSFVLGIAFSVFFATEAVFYAHKAAKRQLLKQWSLFIAATVICAATTPHGINSLLLPFQSNNLANIVDEWLSPDFHQLQPLELWLLSFLALVLTQGIALPVFRVVFLLGLLHLSLKYQRHAADLLSVLSPLILATPFAKHWHSEPEMTFEELWPKTYKGLCILMVYFCGLFFYLDHIKVMEAEDNRQIQTVLMALKPAQRQLGNVLNGYRMGGFLIHQGYPVFIDSRGEIYADQFIEDYIDAIYLKSYKKLEKTIAKYHITWTLFCTDDVINNYLAAQPQQWQRLYSDKVTTIFIHKSVKLSASTLTNLKMIEKKALEKQKTQSNGSRASIF